MCQTRQTYVFSLILIVISNVVASDLRIELKHGGSLIGTNLKSYKGRQIRSFLGIPYAKPPIGDLRFKPPEPFTWEGERNATDDGSQCFQTYFFDPTGQAKGSEDCLFLNIFTPPLYRIPKEGLPVMVNIHGGGWLGGSNSYRFFAPDYILDE
uniref:Carboxylesterase type B domain-containing protein n=1 Tax=Megaselia scalaris TaxID=36166 RepID=T1GNS1_MEGSC